MAKKTYKMFGVCGGSWWQSGYTAKEFSEFLDTCSDEDEIEILMHSPGGSVVEGIAISNLVRTLEDRCTVHVVGWAASIASIITCAAAHVVVDESAYIMIHNPSVMLEGDAAALRAYADTLDDIKATMIGCYKNKFANLSDADLSAMMDAETWISGGQLESKGFVGATVLPSSNPDTGDSGQMLFAASAAIPSFPDSMPDGARRFAEYFASRSDADKIIALSERVETLEKQRRDFQAKADRFAGELSAKQQELDDFRAETVAKVEALNEENEKLKKRISETALNALGTPIEQDDSLSWESAVSACGGDIRKAAEQHPEIAPFGALVKAFGYSAARRAYPDQYAEFMGSR